MMANAGEGGSLRIGTRGSPLALWQARHVAARLEAAHPGLGVELVQIRTRGDQDRETPLTAIGGQGVFTKEIQRALLAGEVDVAVHSLKDLPTAGVPGLTLGAVPEREDITDALVSPRHGDVGALPPGATVGTGSLRRRAQLLHVRPDLKVVHVRGNVETRLGKATSGELDAVILAAAGLRRLGLDAHIAARLGPPDFLPAPGQGALGIECRLDDAPTRERLSALDDAATHRAVAVERAIMAELEAGCLIPLGCWARAEADGLAVDASVVDPSGRERIAVQRRGSLDGGDSLADAVVRALRALGADRLLAAGRDRLAD
jgi:hydroxymethylbilane synthase